MKEHPGQWVSIEHQDSDSQYMFSCPLCLVASVLSMAALHFRR